MASTIEISRIGQGVHVSQYDSTFPEPTLEEIFGQSLHFLAEPPGKNLAILALYLIVLRVSTIQILHCSCGLRVLTVPLRTEDD